MVAKLFGRIGPRRTDLNSPAVHFRNSVKDFLNEK
jgi:hypothetical protein